MRTNLRLEFLSVLAAIMIFTPSPSVASTPAGHPISGSGSYCVAHLEHVKPGSPEAIIASETCFQTFAAAIEGATNGRVRIPPQAGPDYVTPEMLDPGDALDASYVLGYDYDNWHYNADSGMKIWEASDDCSSVNWQVSDINADWDERISSAKGMSNCNWYRHWENANYTGSSRICQPNCYEMGVMNDQTTSLQWRHV